MRRLGRHMGWLGWAVAGVLAVSAGGVALAATGQTTAATGPAAVAKKAGDHLGHLGFRLGRRALHAEGAFQTRDGVKTVVFARGKVTAVSGSSVTIASSDGVTTTFALGADTRFGTKRRQQTKADVKVGVQAVAGGLRSGGGVTARRVVVLPADQAATTSP
jgi:hypothetical protein